ncbi:hypothetical protein PVAG01_08613 [Phlyctema vagabunda]|uniref:DUF2197 domain-containing protein n=1 Tax=Phlyctema vagabunda TaxID=108571 RepID=A0ABR4P9W9_9HELO
MPDDYTMVKAYVICDLHGDRSFARDYPDQVHYKCDVCGQEVFMVEGPEKKTIKPKPQQAPPAKKKASKKKRK